MGALLARLAPVFRTEEGLKHTLDIVLDEAFNHLGELASSEGEGGADIVMTFATAMREMVASAVIPAEAHFID